MKTEKFYTVADAREEKNLQNAREDYEQQQKNKRREERRQGLLGQIEKEKERVKDAIDQNYFSLAKSALERIDEILNKISNL